VSDVADPGAQGGLAASQLARSAASGVRWTSLGGGVAAGLNLVQTLVVARLLVPADFGLMASAMVVITLGNAFADAGLAAAIVARPANRAQLSSLYWLNFAVGVAVCLVAMAIAPLVSDFYDQPRLEGIIRVVSLVFVITSVGQQFGWLLEKELRFRPLGLTQVAGSVAGATVAVTAAALGAGVWALVMAALVNGVVTSSLLTAAAWSRWRPSLRLRWREVRGFLDFGLYQMGERLVNYLSANTDYILIGRYLGQTALGTYSIAYQLAIKPVTYLNPMLNRVAFPVFATRQDNDAAIRRGYLHVVRLVAYATLPVLAGLAAVSPDFIEVVLGDRWEKSAPVLTVLCGVGILRSLANPIGSVLLAKNRPDLGFKGNVLMLISMVVVLLIAAPRGIMYVAWASLGVTLAAYVGWLLLLRHVVGMGLREYAGVLRMPVLSTLVMLAAVLSIRGLLSAADAGPVPTLVCGAGVGALTFLALVARFDGTYAREIWRLFRTRAATG
jgi:O-antigen/teichoic acid export membrane protein